MIAILIWLWLALLASKGTATGRLLRHWLVEAPARWLSRISRGQLLLVLGAVAVFAAMVWAMERDGVILTAMMAPETLAWATMFDASLWIDALAATLVASSAVRLGATMRWVRLRVQSRLRAIRGARRRRVRRSPPPANDDEGRPVLLAA